MVEARRATPGNASFDIYHGIGSATVDRLANITVHAENPVQMEFTEDGINLQPSLPPPDFAIH
jgi:hypothetical protein